MIKNNFASNLNMLPMTLVTQWVFVIIHFDLRQNIYEKAHVFLKSCPKFYWLRENGWCIIVPREWHAEMTSLLYLETDPYLLVKTYSSLRPYWQNWGGKKFLNIKTQINETQNTMILRWETYLYVTKVQICYNSFVILTLISYQWNVPIFRY